ncbi:hypothetical protein HBH98_242920 [Parastagonospora nodorum]|nr:hypothetical protein HBH53_247940 [Parastagonospora nodorum]KAH3956392.1 hypothetical protein HBH51_242490 [Parastagonospora nodorum]KAH4215576.1 hypothetical protein HBI06_246740 [Parastagonospora nodorum]KAH4223704.1 hypothetical protein HBI05_242660 [Parastagonospora nodorum]KAH4334326.1 hypothetical protein HBH98_242920 [Parastagonospora nodorum]
MDTPETMSDGPVVCVFCGASEGTSAAHMAAARSLAHVIHENSLKLVYGGGTSGLMGEVARTLVSLSGPSSVHGIIPRALTAYEQSSSYDAANPASHIHETVYGRTTVVADMHIRKKMMAREVLAGGSGGGYVALSGGYGTFEELMEVTTWNQLGIHSMPIVVFNVDNYWTGVMEWCKNAVRNDFVSVGNAEIVVEALSAEGVIKRLLDYKIAPGRFKLKWEKL